MKLSEVKADLETLDGFEQWLNLKQPEQVVGVTTNCLECPLSRFYSEQTSYEMEFYQDRIEVCNGDEVLRTLEPSNLVTSFIKTLDAAYNDFDVPVTATDALVVLRSVKQC